jgi:hypothetical protein
LGGASCQFSVFSCQHSARGHFFLLLGWFAACKNKKSANARKRPQSLGLWRCGAHCSCPAEGPGNVGAEARVGETLADKPPVAPSGNNATAPSGNNAVAPLPSNKQSCSPFSLGCRVGRLNPGPGWHWETSNDGNNHAPSPDVPRGWATQPPGCEVGVDTEGSYLVL